MNLRRILAFIITIGLAVFLCLGILAYATDRIIYEPRVYLDSFEENGLYAKVPGRLTAFINNQFLDNEILNLDFLTSQFSQDTWDNIFSTILPQDFIRKNIEGLTYAVFSYINLESQSLEYTVDLLPMKEGLSGDQSSRLASYILDGLPECDAVDALSLIEKILSGNINQIQACRLPDPYNTYVEGFLIQSIQAVGMNIPDTLVINPDVGIRLLPSEAQESLRDLMNTYRVIRIAITILPFFPLAMFPLLILVTYRDANEILSYFGWGFSLGGIAGLLISLLEFGFRGVISNLLLRPWQSIVGEDSWELIVAISSDIIVKFTATAGLIAGIFLVLGVMMLLGRRLLSR